MDATHARTWLPDGHPMVPGEELQRRLGRLQRLMQRDGIDAIVISQLVDALWVAGTIVSGWIVVHPAGEPKLYLHRGRGRARTEGGWDDVSLVRSSRDLVARAGLARQGRIGLELDVMPAGEYRKLAALLGDDVDVVDAGPLLREARSVKSAWELDRIDRAAAQVQRAMGAVLAQVVPGVRELDVAIAVEHELRRAGHQGVMRMRRYNGEMFFGQVSAGESAASASWLDAPLGGAGQGPAVGKGASRRQLRRGDLLVLDLMGCCEGYLSDCTRVVAVGDVAAVPADLQQAQAWCTGLLGQLEQLVRPGAVAADLHAHAVASANEAGLASNFMGFGEDQARFVGHGIGLEVDEPPFIAPGFETVLEPGMVVAIEPKLVFPGRAAVGIEDAFVVTAEGCRALSAMPREIAAGGL